MRPTAKRVILELLSASGTDVPIAGLVVAAGLLGISENSVRVTVARLLATGTLEAVGRGAYKLGQDTAALTREVTGWRDLERRVRRWDGGWICVHGGELSRSDRPLRRRRERALRLLGFREVAKDLEVRPDNLEGGAESIRARLHALGLEPTASVFRGSDFNRELEARARGLWDGKTLDQAYRRTRDRLERWLEREPSLPRDTAARESFLMGGEALRQILFDPRLPAPLVDVGERRALLESMRRFDAVGRRIWQRLFGITQRLVVDPDDDDAVSALRGGEFHG